MATRIKRLVLPGLVALALLLGGPAAGDPAVAAADKVARGHGATHRPCACYDF